MTLDEALSLSKPLKDFYDGDEKLRALIDTARALEGMPRHASTHAAGVVITEKPLTDYVPLARNDESVVCQFSMRGTGHPRAASGIQVWGRDYSRHYGVGRLPRIL